MKRLVLAIIATVMFGFVGNAKNVNVADPIVKISGFEMPVAKKFSFSVCANMGFFSVCTQITCYRGSAHSPVYDCEFGRAAGGNGVEEGFINIEKLDSKFIEYINENKLTSIEISKSEIVKVNNISFSIQDGKYEILKDDLGRYLKVKVLSSK